MNASNEVVPQDESKPIPLNQVEQELSSRLKVMQQGGTSPILRACLSNLVIFCNQSKLAEEVVNEVPGIIALHPARVLLLIGETGSEMGDLTATVSVRPHQVGSGRRIYSEQITLRAHGQALDRLPFVVRTLIIGDLPLNLWWAIPEPPALGGALVEDLSEHAQQIIFDSIGWLEPARGVVATASWLAKLALGAQAGKWRVASDLNWRRLKYWRRLLGQALDPVTAPGALESITEVYIEHGPHAVIQAWELVGWMASRLGWVVQGGKVQPGLELSWQFRIGQGTARVRIHRLPEGPSEIRKLRISCTLQGQPAILNMAVESQHRLSVCPEGIPGAVPRTVAMHPQPLAELVGHQLSDREPDPVFQESMGLCRALARSVLG